MVIKQIWVGNQLSAFAKAPGELQAWPFCWDAIVREAHDINGTILVSRYFRSKFRWVKFTNSGYTCKLYQVVLLSVSKMRCS